MKGLGILMAKPLIILLDVKNSEKKLGYSRLSNKRGDSFIFPVNENVWHPAYLIATHFS